MPNRDRASLVPAGRRSRARSLRVVSIATIPFRVVSGPTTTTPLPTMIHPSLAAADPRRTDDESAGARKTTALRGPCKKKQGEVSNLALDEVAAAPNSVQGSIGLHNERRRDFRRLHSLRIAGGRFDLHDLSCRPNCGASRTQLQELGVDCRDSYRAAGASTAVAVAELARQERRPCLKRGPYSERQSAAEISN